MLATVDKYMPTMYVIIDKCMPTMYVRVDRYMATVYVRVGKCRSTTHVRVDKCKSKMYVRVDRCRYTVTIHECTSKINQSVECNLMTCQSFLYHNYGFSVYLIFFIFIDREWQQTVK